MKGKVGKGPPSTDLLVCFPTRAHLTLIPPKPICSPIRPSDTNKGQPSHHHHHPRHHHHHHHRRKRSIGAGQVSSPVLWAKNKPMSSDISEPTSPKVTCAGQIKVRPKPTASCKNWQSVMEEIERLHDHKKNKKRPAWAEALGFKKDVMQFLTCLRNIRFDFRCFGAFPTTEITSEEEEGDEDNDDDDDCQENDEERESSRTVFSKWFMVLQEENKEKNIGSNEKSSSDEIMAPPPNALLLMRCRSAPAKSWLEEREEEEEREKAESHNEKHKVLHEERVKEPKEEKIEKNENLALRYGGDHNDFYKFSSEIAKETWIVGGIRDSLSRSRSWKS